MPQDMTQEEIDRRENPVDPSKVEEIEYLDNRIEEAQAKVRETSENEVAVSRELEAARNARSPEAPREPGEGGPQFVASLNRLEDVETWRERIDAENESGELIPVE